MVISKPASEGDIRNTEHHIPSEAKRGVLVNSSGTPYTASGGGATFYIPVVDKDSGDSNITYLGEAVPGTATSAASWRIQRYQKSGTAIITTTADGDGSFDNIWDNRESLSYS